MTLRRRFARVVASGRTSDPATPAPQPARQKGGTPGKMRRAKPPNVFGRGPLLDERGFGVVVVCIVKDEADYLEEWLAYHFALGIDHVLVYDNGSTDGSAELLERYQNHGLVTRIDWPLSGGQLAAYNHSLRFFGATSTWLAYFDVDEFLVPLLDDDIPSFLARFDDAADVRVPRLEFGYSGHRTRPPGLSIDAYTETANVLALDPSLPPRVKSIVQPGAVTAVDVHLAFPADELPEGVPSKTVEVEVRGVAQLNHYYTRSLEEFEAKRFRGSATGRIARPAVPFDIPMIATDTAAARFSERTSEMLERLRGLDPRPYTYGSQLRLEHFPRPNDLGRFAEFALANTAVGLEEPRRVAAARIKNLHDGVGLVGDLAADAGFEPIPGALSDSVHTEVLVEHMRGRIDARLDPTASSAEAAIAGDALTLHDDGSATLEGAHTASDLVIELRPDTYRRCYALGFCLGADAPVRLEARVESSDGADLPGVTMACPASAAVAGIVEVVPVPIAAGRLILHVETDAQIVRIYDLFVISNG